MTTEIEDSFVEQFEADAHLVYQRKGSAARNTIRTKNNVKGKRTTFQVAGKARAGSKSRHGQVVASNASRDPVQCDLADRYASEWIDELDELKVEHNERQVVVDSLAHAMGRDTDEIIFAAMDLTSNVYNSGTAITFADATHPLAIMTAFGNASVPFDGNLFAAVCWEAWADLLDIQEFSDADYVGETQLWHEGVTAKKWLGFNFYPHEALPDVGGTADRKQFFYHRTAVGHAIQKEPALDVTWQGKEQAHLFVMKMVHGAKVIEANGILEVPYDNTP